MSMDRACLYVDLNAIRHNLTYVKSCVGKDCDLIFVAKANCYGLGAGEITTAVEDLDFIKGFAVVSLEEAMRLKKAGIKKNIIMLSTSFASDIDSIVKHDISPTVFTMEDAMAFSKEAVKQNKSVKIHLKIETGMNRTGYFPSKENALEILEISKLPGIEISGIYTHLARADEVDGGDYTCNQKKVFLDYVYTLKNLGLSFSQIHFLNSAGATEYSPGDSNLARVGIIIYGIDPCESRKNEKHLKPVLRYEAKVINVKKVPKDSAISYGGTFVTQRESIIATISCGYADGIPRSLSSKGHVLLHGKKAPMVGRVCMDQLMVDVTDIPLVKRFDTAVIIGQSENEFISIEEFSTLSDRLSYEVLCDMEGRVVKRYI